MKAIDLIKKYPITTKEIKKFYVDKMVESAKKDNPDFSAEISTHYEQNGLKDELLAIYLQSNPGLIFKYFDLKSKIITIDYSKEERFFIKLNGKKANIGYLNEFVNREEAGLNGLRFIFKGNEENLVEKT